MGFIVKGVKSVVKAVVGVASKVIGAILGPVVGLFKPKKAAKSSANLRLSKDLTPEAYKKIVFGLTASGLDLRFWQVWGAKGTNYDEVLALACHRINAVKEFYLEDELAISAAGAVQSKYVGVLSRDYRRAVPGEVGLNAGTLWTAATCPFTGSAHMKLAWVPTEASLPNGIPSRYTQIVEGALVYDPRRDSTAGGVGAHRINDRTTWEYAALDSYGQPIGRNNALQTLWYLLGWYIPHTVTGEMVLVAGRGIEPSDINIDTFIQGANDCEAAGYYTDCILSTEDSHTSNEDKLTAGGLIAQLIDTGGLWCYYANVDDTANIAIELTDADVLQGGSVTWNEYRPISEQYQQVTGKFIDPSPNALFQLNGYPGVRDTNYETLTGLKRRKTQDFEVVQDVLLAQKLARLLLNLGQYQAEFAGPFLWRALRAQVWSNVRYTSERFGWTKLFKVYRHDITQDSGIQMLLREIHPSIWTAGSVTQPIAPSAGVKYDPRQEIVATGITYNSITVTSGNGSAQDGVLVGWTPPPSNAKYTEVRLRKVGDAYWQGASPAKGDYFVSIVPVVSGTLYEVQVRHISIHEVAGPWKPDSPLQFTAGTNAAMPWDYVSDPAGTRPDNNADVTADALPAAFEAYSGRPITEILNDFDINLGTLAEEMLRNATYRGETDQVIYMADGTPVRQIVNVLSANYQGHEVFIASLKEVDGNGNAKAVNTINSDGVITGTTNVLTGGQSSYYIMANEFGFVDPTGGPGGGAIKPFYYVDGRIYMDNVYIKKLAFGAMDEEFSANQDISSGSGVQKLPGGVILQWGQYRGAINDEVSLTVLFHTPFPNAVFTFIPVPYIGTPSNLRDLWLQVVGEPTLQGANVYTQAATNNQQHLDGFNWFAVGI